MQIIRNYFNQRRQVKVTLPYEPNYFTRIKMLKVMVVPKPRREKVRSKSFVTASIQVCGPWYFNVHSMLAYHDYYTHKCAMIHTGQTKLDLSRLLKTYESLIFSEQSTVAKQRKESYLFIHHTYFVMMKNSNLQWGQEHRDEASLYNGLLWP